MSARDVDELVLRPMLARLEPPRHVRCDDTAVEGLLDSYRLALSRYSRPVLKQGWELAASRITVWCWPLPSEIAAACHEIASRTQPDGWEAQKAVDMADAYTRRFMKTSVVASKREQGGYEHRLREYVWEAAYVERQGLLGREGTSYTASVLFQRGEGKEERDACLERAKEQGRAGAIKVTVPRGLVEQWKREPACQGRGR